MLKESDAIILYKLKFNASGSKHFAKGRCGPISKLFGISARAVRDIWNRKTWAYATRHLWSSEDSFEQGSDWTESSSKVLPTTTVFFFRRLEKRVTVLQVGSGKQSELKMMRRVGRPKGSRDKKARVKKIVLAQTILSDHDWAMKSSPHGFCDQTFAYSQKTCTTSNTSDGLSWIDFLRFSAESDPFRLDWPHW